MSTPLGLLDRRLLIVTGKGGVGKSTVSAALAECAAARGRRTLVCELDAKGDLARILGTDPVDYSGREVRPDLVAMTMDTEQSLAEYLKVQVKIPFLGRIGPLARVLEFVATAAPGVREILTIGKLAWEARESDYDLVIADATATGHIVGQLSSPAAIRDLVRLGMIRHQLDWMLELLEDPSKTSAIVVATPEEMPVVETMELVGRVRDDTHIDVGAAVVNRVLPAPFTAAERPVFDTLAAIAPEEDCSPPGFFSAVEATTHALRRREVGSSHLRRLREGLPKGLPVLLLPEIFDAAATHGGIDLIAAALAAEANW